MRRTPALYASSSTSLTHRDRQSLIPLQRIRSTHVEFAKAAAVPLPVVPLAVPSVDVTPIDVLGLYLRHIRASPSQSHGCKHWEGAHAEGVGPGHGPGEAERDRLHLQGNINELPIPYARFGAAPCP